MKQLLVLVYFGIVIHARPSHHPLTNVYPIHPGVGAIYKGPNSETIIKGPDGSIITSEADGGVVAIDGEKAAVEAVNHVAVETIHHATAEAVAHQTIGSQAISASAGAYVRTDVVAKPPVVVAETPLFVQQPIVVQEPVPQVVLLADNRDTAALDGPSGSILRHGEDAVISGPSSTTIKDGKHVVDIPNIEVKTTVIDSHPVGHLVAPEPILVDAHAALGPVIVSTPSPKFIGSPLNPRPVLIDTPHPLKPFAGAVPVLIDDTHLAGSTLGTSGPIVVDDSKFLQRELVISTPGPLQHDFSAVSIQNEVIPQVVVSSTPAPILHNVGPIVVPPRAEISTHGVNFPPLLHSSGEIYSTPASHIVGHTNEETISASIAKSAEAEQSYLSALQYASYEKALAAEAERKNLAVEAERKALEAAIQASGGYVGHGILDQSHLNPVVSQGNNIIAGGIVSSTAAPLGVVSSTPPPVLVTSLTPTKQDFVSSGKQLLAVGPQVFQANGIFSETAKPEIAISGLAPNNVDPINFVSGDIVSSTIRPEILDHANPIISRPTAILSPPPSPPEGLGQVVVQSNTFSASETHAHSSVQSSSSTGVISSPVSHGYKLSPGPSGGRLPPSDYADWQQSVVKQDYFGRDGGFPGYRGFPH